MRKIIGICCLIISTLALKAQKYEIKITNDSAYCTQIIDFGSLNATDQPYKTVVIRNNSSKAIDIQTVRTPSGILASIDLEQIKAGDKQELIVAVMPALLEKKGEQTHKVQINSSYKMPIIFSVRFELK